MTKIYNLAITFCLALCTLALPFSSRAQGWQWVEQNGGGSFDAFSLATDPRGNLFMGGLMYGTGVNFGTCFIPTSSFVSQAAVAKFNSSGTALWAKGFSGGNSELVNVASDTAGNMLVWGIFQVALTIDAFTLTMNPAYYYQYFLVKIDPSGTVLWADTSGQAEYIFYYYHTGYGMFLESNSGYVTTDASNNIYVAGIYSATTTSVGGITVTNHDPAGGTNDIFVAKYDPSGNVLWATGLGGSGDDMVWTSTIANNKLYLAGNFTSSVMAVGSATLTNTLGANIAFIATITDAGTLVSGMAAGSNDCSNIGALLSDGTGNVYITGSFGGDSLALANATIPRAYPGSSPYQNAFIARLTNTDSINWYKTIGSPSLGIVGYSLALASCNELWLCAAWQVTNLVLYEQDSARIDGTVIYTPDSAIDPLFIAGFDITTGNLIDHAVLQCGGEDQSAITADTARGIYLTSDYEDTYENILYFGTDTIISDHYGDEHFYLAKYDNPACPTGIPMPLQPDDALNIYPVPTAELLHIDHVLHPCAYTICNILGVTTQQGTLAPGDNQLNIGKLVPGIYTIKIATASGSKVYKLVKE